MKLSEKQSKAFAKGRKIAHKNAKNRKPFLGKKHSDKTKEKIRQTNIRKGIKPPIIYGREPWNKNKKGIHLSPETEWKKGNIPWNKGMKGKYKLWNNNPCPMKGKKHSEETLKKLSKNNGRFWKGKLRDKETRLKISKKHKGKKLSLEDKKNKRLARIKYIQNKINNGEPIYPSIGKNEKQILDEIAKSIGYNIIRQYYIKKLGYWADGYCKKLNIIFEIDEKHHFDLDGNLKEKDIERQKNIQEELNCGVIRICDT